MEVSFPPEYILALFSDGLIENYNKSKMSRNHNHDEEFLYKLLIENRQSESMEAMIEKTISSMMGSGRKKDVDNDDDTMLILIKHNP
jgi:hypothetical protein